MKTAEKNAEDGILKTIEETLQNQLGADTISRLNIPLMLKTLKESANIIEDKRD